LPSAGQASRDLSARQRSRFRRADEIVDAAARVFAKLGYFGASTKDIADLLGIRQASLYYYFPSKEAALEEVCNRAVANFVESAQQIADGERSATEKLDGLVHSHLKPLEVRPDYARVFLSERRYLPARSRRRIGRLSRQLERIFEEVLKEGVRTGEFQPGLDTRLATLALLGMLNAVAVWYPKARNGDLKKICETFVRLALVGVAAGGDA